MHFLKCVCIHIYIYICMYTYSCMCVCACILTVPTISRGILYLGAPLGPLNSYSRNKQKDCRLMDEAGRATQQSIDAQGLGKKV